MIWIMPEPPGVFTLSRRCATLRSSSTGRVLLACRATSLEPTGSAPAKTAFRVRSHARRPRCWQSFTCSRWNWFDFFCLILSFVDSLLFFLLMAGAIDFSMNSASLIKAGPCMSVQRLSLCMFRCFVWQGYSVWFAPCITSFSTSCGCPLSETVSVPHGPDAPRCRCHLRIILGVFSGLRVLFWAIVILLVVKVPSQELADCKP